MNNDDFNRASLSGKGRRLFGEEDDNTAHDTPDDIEASEDELSALFDDAPDLGTLLQPAPQVRPPEQERPSYTSDLPSDFAEDLDLLEEASELEFEPITDESPELHEANFNPGLSVESATETAAFSKIYQPSTDEAPPLHNKEAIEENFSIAANDEVESPSEMMGEARPAIETITEEPVFLAGRGNPTAGQDLIPEMAEDAPPTSPPSPIKIREAQPIAENTDEAPTIVTLEGRTRLDAGEMVIPRAAEQYTTEDIDEVSIATDVLAPEGIGPSTLIAEDAAPSYAPSMVDAVMPAHTGTRPNSDPPPIDISTIAIEADTIPTPPPAAEESVPFIEEVEKPPMVRLSAQQHISKPAVEDLIPARAEIPADDRGSDRIIQNEGSGGILAFPPSATFLGEAAEQAAETIPNPFPKAERQPAQSLFAPTKAADPDLLEELVDNGRIHTLWNMIEILQEDIAEQARLSPKRADIYQQELLQASDLLLQSRENYDDARAVVFRIRADLKREAQIKRDIEKYNPILMTYIIGWFIALAVLALLSAFVEDILEEIEADFFAAAYLPVVFGAAGGLFLAYTTLNRHVAVLRDFDRAHIWWYFVSPLIGGLMGLMTFALWVATVITTTTQEINEFDEMMRFPVIVWVLAFLGGIQQNWVINRLRALRDSNINTENQSENTTNQ